MNPFYCVIAVEEWHFIVDAIYLVIAITTTTINWKQSHVRTGRTQTEYYELNEWMNENVNEMMQLALGIK